MTYTLPPPNILTGEQSGVIRSDGAFIPADERNADWQEYQEWLSLGNHPDEAPPVEPPVDTVAEAREAGVVKLVALGLTNEEAMAIATR